jgi:hypothetical protein
MTWLILRDLDIFPPDHHRLVVCQRDLSFEIMEGKTERHHEFTVDMWTGKSWGRLGGGKYLKWAAIPPARMMFSTAKKPTPNEHIFLCVTIPQYFGVRVGRFNRHWELYSDLLGTWVTVPSSFIEGWLPLH